MILNLPYHQMKSLYSMKMNNHLIEFKKFQFFTFPTWEVRSKFHHEPMQSKATVHYSPTSVNSLFINRL
ncbi:MAG: hypothetical protein C4527_28505 [Candidatus Omnitrophota bacterium]|nr:MAG: hypothetical protein C4527_28505 [Candidatus Omnitrophota bacterium]